MKYFEWDEKKTQKLIKERGISFELIVEHIINGDVIAAVNNHPPYENQKVFLVVIDNYVYRVPYVEDDEKYFLKTAYASRKDTKKYLSDT